MPIYKAPVDDTLFLLNDVLHLERYGNLAGFSDVPPDVLAQIIGEAGKICEERLQPLNRSGDAEGCGLDASGEVTTPAGFKEAYREFVAGGWVGLAVPPEYDGQGLPYTLAVVTNEFASAANMSFAMYPGLTQGALAALLRHGSEEQKRLFAPPMAAGRWTGTMNLTEPQCGTDLGLLTTKASPRADGSYAITGQKIFISAGEHDLSENIIHLVLARIEGAPAGVKGISLFIVPKYEVNPDGTLGARNAVRCGALEHKMGIHGNATCVMNYDGARGFLVGEPNRGLNAMFVMMNEARLGVAVQGLAQSEVAYQNAAAYAKERLQGRALTGAKNAGGGADPIIVHSDVRRALMEMKAFNEAARGLALATALDSDIAHRSEDAKARQAADDRLGLLTPVLKGVLTDLGFESAVKAQQIWGGHGYIDENGVEQFVRDARITMIYEGANGIQALDLVGRKLPKDNGRAAMAYFAEVSEFIAHESSDEMKPFVEPLKAALGDLQKATIWLMQNALAKPDNGAGASYDYMHLFGRVALGYTWARIARAALAKKKEAQGDGAWLDAKLTTGKFYMEKMLPETGFRLARITAGVDTLMSLPAEMF
ncbi:acyl-CoA dehydrogenase [Methylosinus sporium]|uniref:3-methylmercaptopropionyl-CoA dehydrogenase n=1 Tax=Methylosinus sporium TaxID=428 RepID=A0A549T970_METSR|nr:MULTISPECIES: acyl-CoA dehydrogenase C-terminal domain-containing protein [Methylosinus]MBU3889683.1 acyl-CoA dehydrogenase C-terminal domain-containing protein [Methylosinus sp. KRF6]TRL38410.1 acyl-CoA dehydrogenase [Methylosinus sporium]